MEFKLNTRELPKQVDSLIQKKDMPKRIPQRGAPEAHDELLGFDIKINRFGEIISTLPVEELNDFLNEKVLDKKLTNWGSMKNKFR